VLHFSDADLPTPSIPSVRVTAIGTGTIAVPKLARTSRTSIERSEAALTQTRLTLHRSNIRPSQNEFGQPPHPSTRDALMIE
jgi:hypothetical protein